MDSKNIRNLKLFLNALLAILGIVLIILLVGLFFQQEREPKVEKELDEKKKRLDEVEKNIKSISELKEKIEKREKITFLIARIIIGAILTTSNMLHYFYCVPKLDFGIILNFNGVILLGYGFIAYILYGNIERFTNAMKSKTTHLFRKASLPSLEELEMLIQEKETLLTEIKALENYNQKTAGAMT